MGKRTVTGVVSNISEKQWVDNRSGDEVTLYSFQVEGERGWFRTGTTRPPVAKGSAYRFVVDTTKGNVELDSIEAVEGSEVTRAPSPSANSRRNSGKFPPKGSGNDRDTYWKDKDKYYKDVEVPRITWSSCQTRAIEVVKMALANEAINLGTAKNKRLDNLLAVVDEVTTRFYNQVDGAVWNDSAEDGKPFDDEIPFGDEDNNDNNWDD